MKTSLHTHTFAGHPSFGFRSITRELWLVMFLAAGFAAIGAETPITASGEVSEAAVLSPAGGSLAGKNSGRGLDDRHRLTLGDKISFQIQEDLDDPKETLEPKALVVADDGEIEIPYIGRVRALMFSIALYSVFTALQGVSVGLVDFGLYRFLAGIGTGAELIVGSGNLVHNLRLSDFALDSGYEWAARFDALVRARIEAGDHGALAAYPDLGPDARLAVPTPEHYLPLLYTLGVSESGEHVSIFNAATVLGSISMTSVVVGASVASAHEDRRER